MTGKSVYAIRSDFGPVKIGISTNPQTRLAQLLACQPYAGEIIHIEEVTDRVAAAVEAAAHAILSAKHRRGEWFDVGPDEAISAIKEAVGVVSRGEKINEINRKKVRLNGNLVRAARALLGLSQADLCEAAGISRATLLDVENGTGDPRKTSQNAVQEALQELGIVFDEENTFVGCLKERLFRANRAPNRLNRQWATT